MLVEEQTEVGEYHPEFLPTVAVFEFTKKVATQLVLNRKKQSNIKGKVVP